MRAVAAVVIGYVVWTVMWLGGNAVFFRDAANVVATGQPFTDAGALIGLIAVSVVCSVAGGRTAAIIARAHGRLAVVVLAALLLFTGIVVQISAWPLLPIWYHLTFLALIVPATILGSGRFGLARHVEAH